MKIGGMQPVYLPWLGYFEQMAYTDAFVIMDDAQFTRRDWRNRNRIKSASGSFWLTVPVHKQPLGTAINEIRIDYHRDWVRRHLRALETCYSKSAFYQPLYDDLEAALGLRPERLVDLTIGLIRTLCRYLDVSTPIVLSSEIPTRHPGVDGTDVKNQRILEYCRFLNGDAIYLGKKASDYIDIELFRSEGIEVVFQDYQHPVYRQRFGVFESHLSVVDLIMNVGPAAGKIVRSSPQPLYAGAPCPSRR